MSVNNNNNAYGGRQDGASPFNNGFVINNGNGPSPTGSGTPQTPSPATLAGGTSPLPKILQQITRPRVADPNTPPSSRFTVTDVTGSSSRSRGTPSPSTPVRQAALPPLAPPLELFEAKPVDSISPSSTAPTPFGSIAGVGSSSGSCRRSPFPSVPNHVKAPQNPNLLDTKRPTPLQPTMGKTPAPAVLRALANPCTTVLQREVSPA